MSFFETLVNMVSQFKGLTPSDYCHIETTSGIDQLGEHNKCLLMTTGGLISAIDLNGLNKIVGAEESKEAHGIIIDLISNVLSSGSQIDWGFSQNGLESEKMLDELFTQQISTANQIGLNVEKQINGSRNILRRYVRPEHNIIYIITPPKPLNDKEHTDKLKKMGGAYMKTFDQHRPAQSFIGIISHSEQLRVEHEAVVQTAMERLSRGGYTYKRLSAREIPWAIRRDAGYEIPPKWEAWFWGDDLSFRGTPEDKPNENKLINWGGLNLGMQMHDNDIMPTGKAGIAKVGKYYVAPLLIEMLPNREKWVTELLSYIPSHVPFRYRAHIKKNKTGKQQLGEMLARVTDFSKKYLPENHSIAQSFNYINDLAERKIESANIAISMCTWHTNEKQLISNVELIKAKIASWGQAQVMVERGDLMEAVLSTIPAYSTTLFTPDTMESIPNIAKLVPHTRPATPFSTGTTPLRTPTGKLWPVSPISSELPAYIEIIVASSGAGKSVYQNAINRDNNFMLGSTELARHVTIDVGFSGKGTVMSLRSQLPPNRAHEAVYEKLTLSEKHAFNPMDLQLGARTPTPLDRSFIVDFVTMIATPQNRECTKLMPELVAEVVDAAYDAAFDKEKAKRYEKGINLEIDKVLNMYPEVQEEGFWGLRKTWLKVTDFLFSKGHIREARVAQRYVVPLIPELPSIMAQNANILSRFSMGSDSGIALTDEFTTLISAAAKAYPLLTQPTVIDFDSAKYLVLDLNDVTQDQSSQQTGIMYSLSAQMGTRDFWLSSEDLMYFRDEYKDYMSVFIQRIRETKLGVTFEEFRRTAKQPRVRSMINRWMAEGRKFGVRVQIVMQQPNHADEEMFGHATMLTLMGTWNGQMLKQLDSMGVELSETEKDTLLRRVHGATQHGSSMIIRYNLKKSGWGSQLLYLTKSPVELWSSTTTAEDVRVRELVEDLVGDTELSNEVLCTRFPKGTVIDVLEEETRKAIERGEPEENIYSALAEKAVKSWSLLKGKG